MAMRVNRARGSARMIPLCHMIDAERAKGCAVLLGFGLACRHAPTDARPDEVERAGPEQKMPSPDEAAPREPAALSAPRVPDSAPPAMRVSESVGGRWVSCYANYRASSAPERDVARLGAMCGPENGMIPACPIASGDANDNAQDHRFEAVAGDCFRVFAVADAFVADLGIEVTNPRGNAITWDRNGDRWPILNPDGLFCVFDTGTYTVRVRALQGKGRYAMQVWRLP